jgi:two-component system, LytTR family, response regulator
MHVLIVDDEEAARVGLEKLLIRFTDDVSVIEMASSVSEAVEMIEKDNFNLVFLDVQMAGGNGFTLFDKLQTPSFSVVFTTAHAEYAIQAFRAGAVDYLLKPIDPDALIDAVAKVKKIHQNEVRLPEIAVKTKIGVPLSSGIRFINIDQIIRLESSRNYTTIFMVNEKPLLVTKSLKEFEDALSNQGFVRVHNSHVVKLAFVKEYQRNTQGMLLMEDDFQVPISRIQKELVKTLLANQFGII